MVVEILMDAYAQPLPSDIPCIYPNNQGHLFIVGQKYWSLTTVIVLWYPGCPTYGTLCISFKIIFSIP
jgi:hypothetical protein